MLLSSPSTTSIGSHGISSASKRRKRTSFIESVIQIAIPGAASAQDCSKSSDPMPSSEIAPSTRPVAISSFLVKLNAVADALPRDSRPPAVAPQRPQQPSQAVRKSLVKPPRSHYKQVEEPPAGIQITELDSPKPTSKFAKQLKKAARTYVEQNKIDDDMFDSPEPYVT